MPLARFPATSVAVSIVVLLALAIRVWGVGAQSLWHDEVLTTLSATVPFREVWNAVESNENKPPLYFYVMNLWVRIGGLSELSLRLPSVIFGVASVAVLFLLGRDLFDDERVGLVAALLLAFSRFHIAYSQEARTYSLLFLLLVLAGWLTLRIVKRVSAADQIGYVVCAALAMYAHPFAAFALAAMNLFYFACYALGPAPATPWRRWLVLQCAFTLAFAPWLSRTWLVVQTGLPWLLQSTSFSLSMLAYAGSLALAMLMAVVGCVGLGYGIVKRERGVILLVLLILLPIVIPLAFASRLYQTFIPRYGIIIVAGFVLLVAYGATKLRPWATVLVCAAYVIAALAHFRPGYGNHPGAEPKPNIRLATRYITETGRSGDAVAAPGEMLFQGPLRHYLRGTDLRLLAQGERPDPGQNARFWAVSWPAEPEGESPPPQGYGVLQRVRVDNLIVQEFAALPPPTTSRTSGPP